MIKLTKNITSKLGNNYNIEVFITGYVNIICTDNNGNTLFNVIDATDKRDIIFLVKYYINEYERTDKDVIEKEWNSWNGKIE